MQATVGTALDTEDMVATAQWALPVDMVAMLGLAPMWLPTPGPSTLQRGLRSQRLNPNTQSATPGWVVMGWGLGAILPSDTLFLLTLLWATPATQGAMGFTMAMEATVDSMEGPTMAK